LHEDDSSSSSKVAASESSICNSKFTVSTLLPPGQADGKVKKREKKTRQEKDLTKAIKDAQIKLSEIQRPAKKACRKRVEVEVSPPSSESEGERSKGADGMCMKDMEKMTEGHRNLSSPNLYEHKEGWGSKALISTVRTKASSSETNECSALSKNS
jgi:hypothetical protein